MRVTREYIQRVLNSVPTLARSRVAWILIWANRLQYRSGLSLSDNAAIKAALALLGPSWSDRDSEYWANSLSPDWADGYGDGTLGWLRPAQEWYFETGLETPSLHERGGDPGPSGVPSERKLARARELEAWADLARALYEATFGAERRLAALDSAGGFRWARAAARVRNRKHQPGISAASVEAALRIERSLSQKAANKLR